VLLVLEVLLIVLLVLLLLLVTEFAPLHLPICHDCNIVITLTAINPLCCC
jgi:hypothetical protein